MPGLQVSENPKRSVPRNYPATELVGSANAHAVYIEMADAAKQAARRTTGE
jgi:hypothetical protein